MKYTKRMVDELMQALFIISDIHGHIDQFEELLQHWDTNDHLVILGDLIDRGPNSLAVIRKVMELKQNYPDNMTFIKGNHEDMLLKFLENPTEKFEHYYRNGGKETMLNFLVSSNCQTSTIEDEAKAVLTLFERELTFLRTAPLYKVIGKVLLTHAGFNSEFESIDKTTDDEFIWIRKHYETKNQSPYINVFGHTPVHYIHNSNDIWVSGDQHYIGIDGGCYETGQLNALRLSVSGEIIEMYKTIQVTSPSI